MTPAVHSVVCPRDEWEKLSGSRLVPVNTAGGRHTWLRLHSVTSPRLSLPVAPTSKVLDQELANELPRVPLVRAGDAVTAGISPRRGWPGHLIGAPRPRQGTKPRPPVPNLAWLPAPPLFLLLLHLSSPRTFINYLKRAWEGGPTVIHLCALDDSASCCFAGGFFSFLGSPVKPDIIEKRVCSEKARDAQSEIPSSGSEIRQDGSSLGSGLHLFSSGNILNNSSIHDSEVEMPEPP